MKRFTKIAQIVAMSIMLTGGSVVALAAGQTVSLPLDPLGQPEWQVTASGYGGKLLLSDSPEMVPADGITYQDVVQGDARLFFHHVNDTKIDKRIAVVFRNQGDQPAKITVYQKGISGPGYNYLDIGKAVQTQYMKGLDIQNLTVPAHGQVSLVDTVVKPNMLLNGMFDFTSDQPVLVSVMMLPKDMSIKRFLSQASVLPPDQYRLRGTFDGRDRLFIPGKVYDAAADGPVVLTLADNKIDQYLWGIDATNGSRVQNYGNYGVVYKLFLPSEHADKLSVYLNPRGGEYAGAMGVKYRHVTESPVNTPADRLSIGGRTEDGQASYVGTYDAGQSLWLTFSPPGASNLPVKLLIVPEQEASTAK